MIDIEKLKIALKRKYEIIIEFFNNDDSIPNLMSISIFVDGEFSDSISSYIMKNLAKEYKYRHNKGNDFLEGSEVIQWVDYLQSLNIFKYKKESYNYSFKIKTTSEEEVLKIITLVFSFEKQSKIKKFKDLYE
jgi:hypothetical protein